MNKKPSVSVIVPAYNEQGRIADTLYRIKDYLAEQDYESEIIVVDDGSHDLTTEVVKFIDIYGKDIKDQNEGQLMENVKNVGKGFSIARGMIKAKGDIVLFSDADLSTPIEEVEKLIPYFEKGYDVVIGSRKMENSDVEEKPWYRDIMSVAFNTAVQVISVKGIKDTQCGFKAYSREAAQQIALLQRVYGFGFDVEHLYIARKHDFKIKEVAVKWVHMEGSKVSPIKDSIHMFLDLLKIRWIHRTL
ncbi:MAG: glycosyl transferase, group 1 family protein [uncultured Thiotrichaceae bacterium]|uniref:dolichyl-phosphate beta-glucosyltransferase n=1 Tax=uncultured Thiotrichaceae bacterium TaxID=298394 RepID=A0A6S6T7H2_9GAMM|nr:MAG: glycosyl transferase, group 1 family protein [uncultured Thiotrichaceae bacterium]